MRAKILKDKISELNAAKEEGIKEGEKNKAVEIAKNMKSSRLDSLTISKLTGLTVEEVDEIR